MIKYNNIYYYQFPDDSAEDAVYLLENQILSSTARLTKTGTVIDKEEYYPFGDSSLRTFTKKRYRYVGKEKDSESGLYYYGARYYAPWTARFISVDPLAGKYANLTPYNNASNSPIKSLDIDGMQNPEEGGSESSGNSGSDSSGNSGGTSTTTQNTQVHSVQKGDTISGLAKEYGVSQDSIREANPQTQNRSQDDQINVGEDLKIPIAKDDNLKTDSNKVELSDVAKYWESKGMDLSKTKNVDKLTETSGLKKFEMDLNKPIENLYELPGNIVLNVLYSTINEPKIFVTGESWAGFKYNDAERIDAMGGTGLTVVTAGFGKLIGVTKNVGKGLQGFNKFVSKTGPYSDGMYKWQQKASQLFHKNADDLKSVPEFKELERGVGTVNETKKKL
ncbi:MAG: LysM peptidoglycan-binding domain-containing protein [Flavobacteriales bacterium]|nr:LysM peptidoglycan-binding domain-containing protein [Flavobacteriales bacterium]